MFRVSVWSVGAFPQGGLHYTPEKSHYTLAISHYTLTIPTTLTLLNCFGIKNQNITLTLTFSIRRNPKGDGGKGTGKKMSRQFATICDIL